MVARRFIGYDPKGSFYPLSTTVLYEKANGFKARLAHYELKNAIVLKGARKRSSKLELTMFVTMLHVLDSNRNGFMYQALQEIKASLDCSEAQWIEYRDAIDVNQVAQALFNDYFEDMLAFASMKTSRTYLRNWHSLIMPSTQAA